MRLSSFSAGCTSAIIAAALLAGCSGTSQSTSALPGSGATQMGGSAGVTHFTLTKGQRISPMQLLQLQVEGKLPGPVPHATLVRQLKAMQSGQKPHYGVQRGAKNPVIWVSDTNNNYLVGQNKNGKKNLAAINVYNNNCYYPITVKIDHSQNIWNSCEYNSSFSGTSVAEWSSGGTPLASYNGTCPQPVSLCSYWYAYGFDEANNSSNVFAAINFSEEEECNPSCTYVYGSGYLWWPAGGASNAPTYVNLGDSCSPVCNVYYMDVDSSGNLWIDYYGYGNSTYGYGLAEITNPTSGSPTFTQIEAPGTYGFAGGVYVSNGGSTLNVIDQSSRTVNQYTLPLSPGGAPTRVLGPTLANLFGSGDPVSGAFNSGDTKMVIGDAIGWIDIGVVAPNRWKANQNINIITPEGAAYTPSDK